MSHQLVRTHAGVRDTARPTMGVLAEVWTEYQKKIPTSLKVVDAFLAYVLVTGILQFLYVVLVGTFPFNAFLGGFISCVGSFVLTVSLRMQINPENQKHPNNRWADMTLGRVYVDWLFGHLVLLMACINFIG